MVLLCFQHSKNWRWFGQQFDLKAGGWWCPIRSGYYLSASNKCSIKSQRAKEFEGTQWLVRCLWKAKPTGLSSVAMQATDDKTKMASADSSCSSAPLFHGPQTGCTGGGMRHSVCVCVTSKWDFKWIVSVRFFGSWIEGNVRNQHNYVASYRW